jgi:AraC-like DNA-binding protein
MLIQNLYEPFEIEYKEMSECPVGHHKNTFFELVYILRGSGRHSIDNNTFEYDKGHLFLLLPQHVHAFKVTELTSFLFIRFNDIYLKAHNNQGDWIQKLEYILQSNYHLPGCILHNPGDKPLVAMLADAMVREYVNQQEFHKEVIQQLVNTLITIVARNIKRISLGHLPVGKSNTDHIIQYIHEHIYQPEQLKAEVIAAHFNIAATYINEYFRKQTGESLQRYIMKYKLRLVETRLRYSNMRIGEIVNEFSFTDESHLNRVFKKHSGLTPSAFRKSTGA